MSAALDTPILDGAIRSVNFFNGRLLTARDLWRVQLAAQQSDERLGRVLGDGIAQGLEVDAPEPRASFPKVRVQGGLALNRSGETLCLETTTDVVLVQPPDDTAAEAGVFGACCAVTGGTYVAGDGMYLLTLCSAQVTEGRALTSGLDEAAGKCNTDTVARAVQFRLLKLDPFLGRDDFYENTRLRSDHEIRNRVAYKCFGTAALAAYDTSPLSVDAGKYSLLDALRTAGILSDCDVPLAVLYWTLTGGIRFVDNWAVRRRVASPSPTGRRAPLIGDHRLAEAEAMMLQFEAQAEVLRSEQGQGAGAVQAEHYFATLPPAAYLRVGTNAFDWKMLLGVHAPLRETALAGGLARAVVLHAFRESAVPVIGRTATGGAAPVKYRVYRVDGRTDYVLLARSSFAETVARDVHFDNAVCGFTGGPSNVQDAIDELCRRTGSPCTIVLGPGDGWQNAVAALPAGSDAEICFKTGTFTLDKPLEIAGLRHVKVTGAGFGTRLVAAAAESALVLRNCSSVVVQDLHAESGTAGWGNAATRDLGGALSIVDCGSVTVDNVSTRCGSAAIRAAACILVRNRRPTGNRTTPTDVSISRSRCAVGHAQTGILVVNASRTRIRNNDVALVEGASLAGMAADPRHRARLRRQLLGVFVDESLARGKAPPTFDREHAQHKDRHVVYRSVTVPIRTMRELATVWNAIVAELKPSNVDSPQRLAAYLKELASEAALNGGVIAAVKNQGSAKALKTSYERLLRDAAPAAQQGIVVAGALADDVRIRDNVVTGVEQGIHVGVSHGRRRKREVLQAGRVQISGNTVELMVSSLSSGERHAIFVGSCERLIIQTNAGRLQGKAPEGLSLVEPMRLWGRFGRILVTGNQFDGFTRGIYLRMTLPFMQDDRGELPWVVQHNSVAKSVTGAFEPILLPGFTIAVGSPNFS